MDALSEALNTVRMTGAIFFNAEFTAPWGLRSLMRTRLPTYSREPNASCPIIW
jgi:hypothetical protein